MKKSFFYKESTILGVFSVCVCELFRMLFLYCGRQFRKRFVEKKRKRKKDSLQIFCQGHQISVSRQYQSCIISIIAILTGNVKIGGKKGGTITVYAVNRRTCASMLINALPYSFSENLHLV